jgi:(p)ppGpp synthase/HD superfamily hydrolase
MSGCASEEGWMATVTQLTERFDDALTFARTVHRDDIRKGTAIPYLSHLLSVASLVLDQGGDEDEAIAGLLHDTLKDHFAEATAWGPLTRDLLEERFGEKVARIVVGCSDSLTAGPKAAWRERKQAYLEHLRAAPVDVLRVSLADKLHNARAIVADWHSVGDALWARFNPDADQAWYYTALLAIYHEHPQLGPLVDEFARVVDELVAACRARAEP